MIKVVISSYKFLQTYLHILIRVFFHPLLAGGIFSNAPTAILVLVYIAI